MTDPDEANKIAARSALLDYYSDKAAAFGGFFLASVFGLLTMLALVQGINLNGPLGYHILLLSIFPVLIFAYVGYYVMSRFSYYSFIADKIEQGDGTKEGKGLRYLAKLEEVSCYFKVEGKLEKKSVIDLLLKEHNKQKSLIGRKLLDNSFQFKVIYWVLIWVLITVAYASCLLS